MGGWGKIALPAACCSADAEFTSTQRQNPISAYPLYGGEPLPWDGTCHALYVRQDTLSACHRSQLTEYSGLFGVYTNWIYMTNNWSEFDVSVQEPGAPQTLLKSLLFWWSISPQIIELWASLQDIIRLERWVCAHTCFRDHRLCIWCNICLLLFLASSREPSVPFMWV